MIMTHNCRTPDLYTSIRVSSTLQKYENNNLNSTPWWWWWWWYCTYTMRLSKYNLEPGYEKAEQSQNSNQLVPMYTNIIVGMTKKKKKNRNTTEVFR